jgi:hypothetical protein
MSGLDDPSFEPADFARLLQFHIGDELMFAARRYAEARRCDTWIAADDRLCLVFIARFECCDRIKPTRDGLSYAELRHARTLRHISHLANVQGHEKDVQTLVEMMVKYPVLRLSSAAARAALASHAARLALDAVMTASSLERADLRA